MLTLVLLCLTTAYYFSLFTFFWSSIQSQIIPPHMEIQIWKKHFTFYFITFHCYLCLTPFNALVCEIIHRFSVINFMYKVLSWLYHSKCDCLHLNNLVQQIPDKLLTFCRKIGVLNSSNFLEQMCRWTNCISLYYIFIMKVLWV